MEEKQRRTHSRGRNVGNKGEKNKRKGAERGTAWEEEYKGVKREKLKRDVNREEMSGTQEMDLNLYPGHRVHTSKM